jgi:hypothetical protein
MALEMKKQRVIGIGLLAALPVILLLGCVGWMVLYYFGFVEFKYPVEFKG